MKNKLIMLGVLMFSMMSFAMVSAQDPISDFAVTAGQTNTADFGTTTTADSTTLGGLISQIVETSHRTVKMNGVVVSDKINTTKINNFSLYLFGDITQINYNNLVSGNIYQTSENVNVRNVTGVWVTYNVNSTTINVDPAKDKAAAINENFTADDGTFVKAISETLDGNGGITFSTGTITTTQFEGATLCGGLTSAEAKVKSGSTSPKDTFCGQFGTVKVIAVIGTTVGIPKRFIYDLDNDGNFDDMTEIVTSNSVNGYKVNSQNGQALALIPANTYDLFAII